MEIWILFGASSHENLATLLRHTLPDDPRSEFTACDRRSVRVAETHLLYAVVIRSRLGDERRIAPDAAGGLILISREFRTAFELFSLKTLIRKQLESELFSFWPHSKSEKWTSKISSNLKRSQWSTERSGKCTQTVPGRSAKTRTNSQSVYSAWSSSRESTL